MILVFGINIKYNRLITYIYFFSDSIEHDVDLYLQNKDTKTPESSKGNIIDLVRTPVMRMYTLAIGFNWFLCGLCFYGVSQFIGQLGKLNNIFCQKKINKYFSGGNIFINVAVSAVIQIPSTFFACWSTKAWGRKNTLIFANILAGISLLLIGNEYYHIF